MIPPFLISKSGRGGGTTGGGGGSESEFPAPVGDSLLFEQFGGEGTNGVLEAEGYSDGIHIPETFRDGAGSNYNPAWYTKTDMTGIDLVYIKAGTWSKIELFGLKGTADHPIWVLPENDEVVNITQGIYINDCEHLIITGLPGGETSGPLRPPTDEEAAEFRFQIGSGDPDAVYSAVQIFGRCKHIHIRGLSGDIVWYGCQTKTDPMCDTDYNFPGWIIDTITFKHFKFSRVLQDVMYWGNSSHMLKTDDPVNGRDITCSTIVIDDDPDYLPMKMKDTEVAYGNIERCGRQAVVIGGCYYGTHRIHDLKIRHCGYELNQGQGEAIGNGGMNKNVRIYNIDAQFTFLYGCADFGQRSFIYGNVFDKCGFLDPSKAFDVPSGYSYFLKPGDDLSALVASRPTEFENDGGILKNINAGGVYNISSTTKITYPTDEPKTSFIYNNRFGENSRGDGVEIAFEDYGPAANWTENSVVAGNTLLDDVTPATITRFTYLGNPWPVYSTDIGDIP